mmetsp:Transcript_23443/g.69414  ORF Transcript_23443/g.69414 Transcript_23443/m.69414 type:complete len:202 (+) Transcript_23443:3365-3970(+)
MLRAPSLPVSLLLPLIRHIFFHSPPLLLGPSLGSLTPSPLLRHPPPPLQLSLALGPIFLLPGREGPPRMRRFILLVPVAVFVILLLLLLLADTVFLVDGHLHRQRSLPLPPRMPRRRIPSRAPLAPRLKALDGRRHQVDRLLFGTQGMRVKGFVVRALAGRRHEGPPLLLLLLRLSAGADCSLPWRQWLPIVWIIGAIAHR